MAAKHFNRFKQYAGEKLSVREKSDRLTETLSEAEKKVEEIRSSLQTTIKKVHACTLGTGTTFEKHQKRLPQYALGSAMIDSAQQMESSVLGNTLKLIGQAEVEVSHLLTEYEISMESDLLHQLTTIVDDGLKKIDKSKKKLSSARLDMDSARNKYQSLQDKFSPKAEMAKSELNQAINHFEQSQDTYATDLFGFLSRERELATLLHKMIVLQISLHKQTLTTFEELLPHIDKQLDVSNERPVYGLDLSEHLKISERTVSYVIEECCLALREKWMNTEGLFRIAGSAAKLKLLKSAFDAGSGCVDLTGHDVHTIAGSLKQYLRELPDPLLTFNLYKDWVTAANIGDEGKRQQQVWLVTKQLPKENFENLRYLMYFLHDLSLNHEETKMNVYNIAIVLGPNLLWQKEESLDGLVGETALYTRIAECFIKHPSYYFGDPPSLPTLKKPQHLDLPPLEDTTESEDVYSEEPDSFERPQSMTSITSGNSEGDSKEEPEEDSSSPSAQNQSFKDPFSPQSEGKPTPPVRRNRSVRKPPPDPPVPSSPKTPIGRPSRPAPMPPPTRTKPRPPPPSPPSPYHNKSKNPPVNDDEETLL